MKLIKKILKWVLYLLLVPILYVGISLILSKITVNGKIEKQVSNKVIYLITNGVHLDVVIPMDNVDSLLLSGIKKQPSDRYLSFGWGDENFYINTPTWGDLTFSTAFKAMFLESSTLMHVTRYQFPDSGWLKLTLSDAELKKLNSYISNTFEVDESGMKIVLEDQGYFTNDNFYKANGSYSCFMTCNSWVNLGFKESGLKSCLWTPFDFGLMNKYE